MSNSETTKLSTICSMLDQMQQTAESASLTGSMEGGEKRLAAHYNRLLSEAEKLGVVPANLFAPIEEAHADYGGIAIESHMLRAALSDPSPHKPKEKSGTIGWLCGIAPFLSSEDLELLIKERIDQGDTYLVPDEMLPAIAPFVSSQFLGQIIRNRASHSRSPQEKPKPEEKEPETESREVIPAPPAPVAAPNPVAPSATSVEELQNILARLTASGLGDEEKQHFDGAIAKALREIGNRF